MTAIEFGSLEARYLLAFDAAVAELKVLAIVNRGRGYCVNVNKMTEWQGFIARDLAARGEWEHWTELDRDGYLIEHVYRPTKATIEKWEDDDAANAWHAMTGE